MTVFGDDGWRVADRDEFLRPDTSMDGPRGAAHAVPRRRPRHRGQLRGPDRRRHRVLPRRRGDGGRAGLEPTMRLVGFAFAGVEPELMGIGPIPATRKVLEQTGLTIDDIELFELNEPFAVQVLTWCDGLGVDPRTNG